jgi:hypothetical protein
MQSVAVQIASMCPGWRVWEKDRRWHGLRAGGFLDRPGDPREFHVEAREIPGLIAAIDAQAALDLAADFPDWAVARDDAGRWAAARGRERLTALTGALLHAAISGRRRRPAREGR